MARDYNTLQADIALWMERDDLATQLPTFIEQAEDMHRFGDDDLAAPCVRVRDMYERVEVVVPNGNGRFLDLPTDPEYLEMRRVRLVKGNTLKRMSYATPENLQYTKNQEPAWYTIHEQVEFDSDAAEGRTFELLYYSPFPRLTDAAPSNWLLTNVYNAYLFAALVQGYVFVDDQDARDQRLADYARTVNAVNEADRRSQQPRGRLQSFNTRVDGTSGLM